MEHKRIPWSPKKGQPTALLLSSDPSYGPPSPGSASNEDRGRPRQARAKHGVFKSLQNGNLAKPRQSRKAASLLSFSKTGPEPPLACPGERAGRTGLWDPSEVVAERGCFKNVEGARPPPLAARPRRRRAPPPPPPPRAPCSLSHSPALKSLPGSMLTCYFLYGGMASFQPRALRSSPACTGATTFRSMD